jgi:hypothetical protein
MAMVTLKSNIPGKALTKKSGLFVCRKKHALEFGDVKMLQARLLFEKYFFKKCLSDGVLAK